MTGDVVRTCELANTVGRNDFSDHCITCGDDGVPMTVLAVDAERCLALCSDEHGANSSVEIALVDAAPGDLLLVHAGTALARLEVAV